MSNSGSIILTYLNKGGRAEATRLAFTVGGIPFEDRRITAEQFAANQTDHTRFPTEQLPVLEVNGRKYTQAMSILRYAGKLAGLYPFDPREALAIDEALDHIFDVYKTEPAFNKTVALHHSANLVTSAGNSPLNAQTEEDPQVRSRKNSPIPPIPPMSRGSPTNSNTMAQYTAGSNDTNLPSSPFHGVCNAVSSSSTTPLNSPTERGAQVVGGSGGAAVVKSNSMSGGAANSLFSSSFDAEACLSQIKLCFRRVCELINYDIYGSPYIASPRPTIADFAVFSLVRQIQRGMIPHIPPTLLEASEFSPLYQLVDILEDYPGVKYFYSQRF